MIADRIDRAQDFCTAFIDAPAARRFVLGRGEYATSIADAIEIAGFVDDQTDVTVHHGLPVLRASDLPPAALVVVASMLRPTTAIRSLEGLDLRVLDYFAFERFSGLAIRPVTFWPEFRTDYEANRPRYDAVRARLRDEQSVDTFDRLVEFRISQDLSVAAGFRYDMVNQYFEDFLELAHDGESFADVGSFDGMTSLEFARRAPGFRHITAFEPSPENAQRVLQNLAALDPERITVHGFGLSDHSGTATFAADAGSSSRVSEDGATVISLRRLDDLDLDPPTFVKIDVEGGEIPAIRGGLATIARYRPRLAISVYHRADDLWRIPEAVDAAGVDYELRLRHYTEGIDETVMFFLPVAGTCG
jgi:FkbM family methyltransferase